MTLALNELGEFVFFDGDAFVGSAIDTFGIHYLNNLNELGIHVVKERVIIAIIHNLSTSNSTTELSNVKTIRQLSQVERYEE